MNNFIIMSQSSSSANSNQMTSNNEVLPSPPVSQNQQQPLTQDKLVNVEVKDENAALNLLVAFINLAQNRGAFRIEESAKIYDCIKMFQKPM